MKFFQIFRNANVSHLKKAWYASKYIPLINDVIFKVVVSVGSIIVDTVIEYQIVSLLKKDLILRQE